MGISKTRLQHLATAAAINLERVSVRICRSYRRFYTRIRRATDARAIGELMKQACEARQNGEISVKHFIALNTAAENQRERLLSAPLSATAYKLIDEIVVVS